MVLDSDTDEDDYTTVVNEPPDKVVANAGNPKSDFHLGW
jgi:hypothetical protein